MADGEIAEDLPKEIVEIGSAAESVDPAGVVFLGRGEIETVVARVVEKCALESERFVVHLPPLGARIGLDLDIARVERSVAGLHRLRDRSDGPAVPLLVEQFLAIARQVKVTDVGNELIDFSLAQVELVEIQVRWPALLEIDRHERILGENNLARLS